MARGARPDYGPVVGRLPGTSRQGWQEKASDAVENEFLVANVWPTLGPTEQALLRSQQGPMAGLPFTCMPITMESRFQPQELRVWFLRRLWQPLPLSSLTCRCGRPLDSRGHHRAACPLTGVLGRRSFSLENAAARVCREAGGWVTTNVRVQDMDLLPLRQVDNRRLEVVVERFRGAQQSAEQPWTKRGGGRSGLTPSWRSSTVVPGWWFWAARWGDDGPKSHGSSWLHLRQPRRGLSQNS